jgi:hypothetical protein
LVAVAGAGEGALGAGALGAGVLTVGTLVEGAVPVLVDGADGLPEDGCE